MALSEWCDSNHVGKATYYKYLRLIRNNLLDDPSPPAETGGLSTLIWTISMRTVCIQLGSYNPANCVYLHYCTSSHSQTIHVQVV